ncbi:MAG: glycosyltransferase [Methanomassiliicoccus sp.]|nr:MAG: glycosyltransferase [Methanomassiliicoccus sp.]
MSDSPDDRSFNNIFRRWRVHDKKYECGAMMQVESEMPLPMTNDPINVLSVNDFDLLNRRFNGYDLIDRLKKYGVESRFIVWKKRSGDPRVKRMCGGIHWTALRFGIKMIERGLGIQNVLYPFHVRLVVDDWFKKADIVHFHLIHNEFFSLMAIPDISRKKKIVWTVHDPWLVTGHCVYPMDCQEWMRGCPSCPHLDHPKIVYMDMSARMCRIKRRIVRGSNIHFVVASEWMKRLLESSPVTEGQNITVIPFGIDLDRFGGVDKRDARRSLGIDDGSTLIAFRTIPGPFKGMDHAIEAMLSLEGEHDITIITFGKTGFVEDLKKRFKVIELGWASEEQISMMRGACDIFVMPSMAEAFGLMAIELMASGVPVIAYKDTAIEEIVLPERTGILVDRGDIPGLRRAIEDLVLNPEYRKRLGDNSLIVARERYDIERQVRQTAELYRSCLDDR